MIHSIAPWRIQRRTASNQTNSLTKLPWLVPKSPILFCLTENRNWLKKRLQGKREVQRIGNS